MSKFLHGVKPVMVEWIDSMQDPGWSHKKTPGDLRCVTIGNLLSRTPKSIMIALSKSAHCDGDAIEIPMVAVKRVRRLKL